jgi:hypothetical protein
MLPKLPLMDPLDKISVGVELFPQQDSPSKSLKFLGIPLVVVAGFLASSCDPSSPPGLQAVTGVQGKRFSISSEYYLPVSQVNVLSTCPDGRGAWIAARPDEHADLVEGTSGVIYRLTETGFTLRRSIRCRLFCWPTARVLQGYCAGLHLRGSCGHFCSDLSL